jgi:phosphoribosylaminoimidazole-succinocarboxamide synthase
MAPASQRRWASLRSEKTRSHSGKASQPISDRIPQHNTKICLLPLSYSATSLFLPSAVPVGSATPSAFAGAVLIATDRMSAFDCALNPPIPSKGRMLTQLSAFWFGKTASIVPNHVRLIVVDLARRPVIPANTDRRGVAAATKKMR